MSFREFTYDYQGAFTLGEIAKLLEKEVSDDTIEIVDVAPLDKAKENHFSFFDNPKYLDQFKNTKAAACVVREKFVKYAPSTMVVIVSDDPYRDYALVANKFYKEKPIYPLIHQTAQIHENAELSENVSIGANTVIGEGVKIGANTKIAPNVTIEAAQIGENCIIHTGVRIGQDGFGFSMSAKGYLKVPQLGGVVIGNNVEIGANTTIDRGAGPNTIIGDHTKIDNLVQIGHNVEIGKFCVLVSQVGVAGSTKIGDYVILGGQVGVSGHLKIGDAAQVAAGSGVIKDIPAGAKIGGYPAANIRDWHKSTIAINKLLKKSGD